MKSLNNVALNEISGGFNSLVLLGGALTTLGAYATIGINSRDEFYDLCVNKCQLVTPSTPNDLLVHYQAASALCNKVSKEFSELVATAGIYTGFCVTIVAAFIS